jgi:hypothetical protein
MSPCLTSSDALQAQERSRIAKPPHLLTLLVETLSLLPLTRRCRERFETALQNEPQRIALREIGETYVLPL